MDLKKVFISYAHEKDSHNEKVFELSERLRSEGIDCSIDQYEISPPEGWPRWSRNQIKQADFVLVVCTETYERRFDGSESRGTGAGAKWEGAIITQELYDSEGSNTEFIPVVFDSYDVKHIPTEMRSGTYYILNSEGEYDDRGLQLDPGKSPSAVVVNLIDSNNFFFGVPAEDVRPVPGVDFAQVVVRLPDGLAAGTCTVSIRAHSRTTNIGKIRIAP